MDTILITGVNGLIGRHLANNLKQSHHIIGYNRTPSNIKGIKEINDDIVNIGKYQPQLKAVKQVYHLAALINFSRTSLKESLKINVLGTKQLLKLCRQNKIDKFVFVSAGATLGFAADPRQPVKETSQYIPPKCHSYAYSKYLAEKAVLRYSQYFKVIIANPSTVYGDHQADSTSLIKLIAARKFFIFFPGGSSYIDINDLITGLNQVMRLGRNKNRYILSTENFTYLQLINYVAQALDKKIVTFVLPRVTFLPLIMAMKIFEFIFPNSKLLNSNILSAFYQYRYFNTNKAKKELKFFPKYRLEDSIRKLYNLPHEPDIS